MRGRGTSPAQQWVESDVQENRITLGLALDRGMFHPIDSAVKQLDLDRQADSAVRVFLAASG
jgi:hypothetical protein